MRYIVPLVVRLVLIGGCAQESRAAPMSTSSVGGSSSKEPEAANSLPLGSAVSGPLTQGVGTINDVRVGPGTVPGAGSRIAPVASRGY